MSGCRSRGKRSGTHLSHAAQDNGTRFHRRSHSRRSLTSSRRTTDPPAAAIVDEVLTAFPRTQREVDDGGRELTFPEDPVS
jgi:hypothetical protein